MVSSLADCNSACARKMNSVKKFLLLATTSILLIPYHTLVEANNSTRELPGERDDFESIRANNKVYVDKSDYIGKLLAFEDRFLCMCRPPRFGKSNFVQMLSAFFRGRKESFAGLAAYDKQDWNTSYPVVHLDFGTEDVSSIQKFSARLNGEIVRIGHEYGVQIDEKLPLYPVEPEALDKLPDGNATKFGQLMYHLTQHWKNEQSVVVLIDEYDYPKRRNSPLYYRYFPSEDQVAWNLETFLNPFFYELERVKRFVKFSFMTCTTRVLYHYRTKYPDTPITFKDITYERQFNKMIGLTAAELQTDLKGHIDELLATVKQPNETFHTLVQKLRERYNGFCFTRANSTCESDCRLYNFHSVMSCLRDKNPDYRWHMGVHPDYNIVNNVTSMTEGDEIFEIFSGRRPVLTISRRSLENAFGVLPERMGEHDTMQSRFSFRAFLVLYGYLTFRGYNEQTDEFVIDFPNAEMRESFRRSVFRFITGKEISSADFEDTCKLLLKVMLTETAENLVTMINKELLKPKDEKSDQNVNFYYRFSGNRIAHILGACDGIMHGVLKVKAFYREIVHRDMQSNSTQHLNSSNVNDKAMNNGLEYIQKFLCDVMVVRLPRHTTYTIKVDVERSAACAMNEVLKTVNTEDFRTASRNQTFHLMGINFNNEEDPIEDWIRVTYSEGKLGDIRASQPRYVSMYKAYADHVAPYASLV